MRPSNLARHIHPVAHSYQMSKPKKKTKAAASPKSTGSKATVQPPKAKLARSDIEASTLYLVPTPIGNLGDITTRALTILKSADLIAAEDTRSTGSLLKHFDIRTPMIACHDHNENEVAEKLVAKIQAGQSIALVSDAGTPLLSDPGYRIMQAAIAAKLNITALPGANAVLPALQLSGLPAYPFYFGGFLPTRSKARKDLLLSFKELNATLVFFEAPHRIKETLADAVSVFGPARHGAVIREISKKFEEAKRDTLYALHQFYSREEARGEIVLVIEGAKGGQKWDEDAVREALAKALKGGAPFREATVIISAQSGWPKRDVYDLALKQKATDQN